jgi:hypothetical protein
MESKMDLVWGHRLGCQRELLLVQLLGLQRVPMKEGQMELHLVPASLWVQEMAGHWGRDSLLVLHLDYCLVFLLAQHLVMGWDQQKGHQMVYLRDQLMELLLG